MTDKLYVHNVPPELAARLKDFDGTKVDLTDPSMRRFVGNAIAVHVYNALNIDDPAKHVEIHDTVMWVLNNLSTAQVKIS